MVGTICIARNLGCYTAIVDHEELRNSTLHPVSIHNHDTFLLYREKGKTWINEVPKLTINVTPDTTTLAKIILAVMY
jgi:hypothetical protein